MRLYDQGKEPALAGNHTSLALTTVEQCTVARRRHTSVAGAQQMFLKQPQIIKVHQVA